MQTDDELRAFLAGARCIAVLGAHVDAEKPAHYVPDYLHRKGYRILPANPVYAGRTLWGEPVRASLAEISEPVDILDVFAGVFKSYFFGGAIALISCHRGFHSRAGAEGVGRAATEAFVLSFIAILVLDFVLGLGWNNVYRSIWPQTEGLL